MDISYLHAQPTVLVVEDDEELLHLHSRWLQGYCNVETATDCETAYSVFADDIDVALLERDLPDGSGDEILKRIREMGQGWSVAFVSGIQPSIDDLDMDFDEYLQKPVKKEEFTSTVERLYLRSEIGERLDEFYSLATKKRLLEAYYPSHELLSTEKYPQIDSRLEELYSLLKYSNSIGLDHHRPQPP